MSNDKIDTEDLKNKLGSLSIQNHLGDSDLEDLYILLGQREESQRQNAALKAFAESVLSQSEEYAQTHKEVEGIAAAFGILENVDNELVFPDWMLAAEPMPMPVPSRAQIARELFAEAQVALDAGEFIMFSEAYTKLKRDGNPSR